MQQSAQKKCLERKIDINIELYVTTCIRFLINKNLIVLFLCIYLERYKRK